MIWTDSTDAILQLHYPKAGDGWQLPVIREKCRALRGERSCQLERIRGASPVHRPELRGSTKLCAVQLHDS